MLVAAAPTSRARLAMACGTATPAATSIRGPAPTRRFAEQAAAADQVLTESDWNRHAVLHEVTLLDHLKELGIDAPWLIVEIMRGHGGRRPEDGMRLVMPCAHASWLPTREAGQTTGTMVSRLARGGSTHLLSGTSAPCLSVMKSVPLGRGHVDTGPTPRQTGFDGTSLWWRAERLHRAVLRDYEARRALFENERAALETRAMTSSSAASAGEVWREHREHVLDWAGRVLRERSPRRPRAFDAWWRVQSWRDGVPA